MTSLDSLVTCLERFRAIHDESHALGIIYGWIKSEGYRLQSLSNFNSTIGDIIQRFQFYADVLKEDAETLDRDEFEQLEMRNNIERLGKEYDNALCELAEMINACENDKVFLARLRKAVQTVCAAKAGFQPSKEMREWVDKMFKNSK